MNINGKCKIFRNEYENGGVEYTTYISTKNQDGEYWNMRTRIQMPKGTTLENNTDIEVKKGFISIYKNKEGLPKIKLVVMEYEPLTQSQSDYVTDDLPF